MISDTPFRLTDDRVPSESYVKSSSLIPGLTAVFTVKMLLNARLLFVIKVLIDFASFLLSICTKASIITPPGCGHFLGPFRPALTPDEDDE